MRYGFPYVGTDFRLTSPQPDTSPHCETMDGLVYHTMCLLTPLAFALYSVVPTNGGMV